MSAAEAAPVVGEQQVLSVRGLSVALARRQGDAGVRLVRDATFSIAPGEVCCLVGESGSGKSVTALALMGLIQRQPGITVSGEARFLGTDVLALPESERRALRGREMAMVFQEPMTYLDPIFTVQDQMQEAVRRRDRLSRADERERMRELLRTVGIHDPDRILRQHPHEMSGGTCQRVMLAMALAARPRLLLADEPTTAIDATLQVQVIALIDHLRETTGMSVLLVTHDMGVAAEIADRVVVMYAGRVVEQGTPDQLFHHPRHPYTRGLLASIPRVVGPRTRLLPSIRGSVPEPARLPGGCAFHPRCPLAQDRCLQEDPPLEESAAGGAVACWRAGETELEEVGR